MPVRLEWYTIFGVSSDHQRPEEFLMNPDFVFRLQGQGPERKYYDAELVSEVLEGPTSIFEGLNRAEFEKAICYCGKPAVRWTGEHEEPAPPGMVFVVHTIFLQEKDSLVVFDWEWRREDQNCLGHPESWEGDFSRKTWPTTT